MGAEFSDRINFGQYKGKSIQEIYDSNPGYLLWLRDAKVNDSGNAAWFDRTVLKALNKRIRKDAKLAAKYKEWAELADGTVAPVGGVPSAPGASAAAKPTPAPKVDVNEARTFAYADQWGAF